MAAAADDWVDANAVDLWRRLTTTAKRRSDDGAWMRCSMMGLSTELEFGCRVNLQCKWKLCADRELCTLDVKSTECGCCGGMRCGSSGIENPYPNQVFWLIVKVIRVYQIALKINETKQNQNKFTRKPPFIFQ